MCIIVSKPKGIEVPSIETLRNCFINNDDGCGFAYSHNGRVIIKKGFMTFEEFEQALNDVQDKKDRGMIFHFRITTHGDSTPENTHPFPVSENYKKLKSRYTSTELAMAHNGIISSVNVPYKSKVSDTMIFVSDQVSKLQEIDHNFYKNEKFQDLLEVLSGSKLSFIDGNGDIINLGIFYPNEGVYYSNMTYKPTQHYPSIYGNFSYWEWDNEDYYQNRYGRKTKEFTDRINDEANTNKGMGYINLRMLPENALIIYENGDVESNAYFEFLIDNKNNVYAYSDDSFEEVEILPNAYCDEFSWEDLDELMYEAGWYIYDLSNTERNVWYKVRFTNKD